MLASWGWSTDGGTRALHSAVILRKSKQRLSLPTVTNLKELKMTVANRYEQWMEEWKQQGLKLGIERGRQEGIEAGEALLLQRLLARRFGPLPQAVIQLERIDPVVQTACSADLVSGRIAAPGDATSINRIDAVFCGKLVAFDGQRANIARAYSTSLAASEG
jgi:hypothetical protein